MARNINTVNINCRKAEDIPKVLTQFQLLAKRLAAGSNITVNIVAPEGVEPEVKKEPTEQKPAESDGSELL